jgi:hypothetical protein
VAGSSLVVRRFENGSVVASYTHVEATTEKEEHDDELPRSKGKEREILELASLGELIFHGRKFFTYPVNELEACYERLGVCKHERETSNHQLICYET